MAKTSFGRETSLLHLLKFLLQLSRVIIYTVFISCGLHVLDFYYLMSKKSELLSEIEWELLFRYMMCKLHHTPLGSNYQELKVSEYFPIVI